VKANLKIPIVAIITFIIGGACGYIAAARSMAKSADSYMVSAVRELSLSHSAKEVAVYSQVLRSLREGDQLCATDRLEVFLDYAVIHFGENYSPEYDSQGWISRALECARDYRATYPHRPSSDWTAKRYDAAIAMKTESK
jgi:hypothetical protein